MALLVFGWLGAGAARARAQPAACDDLDAASLVSALEAELPALRASVGPKLRLGRTRQTLAEYAHATLEPLLALARHGQKALCLGLDQRFERVRLAGPERGHFSAYYHPLVRASRTRHGAYQHPLYRRPDAQHSGLATGEILAGGLDGQRLELGYLDSLATALNVHIEGSATLRFEDGTELNLTTDGSNGQPYQNPFKLARQDGVIPKDLRAPPGKSRTRLFFDAHPDLMRTYWAKDPHFVFFKETPLRGTGKFGQLVAGRSVAVDAERVPLGAALWMRTEVASSVAEGQVRFTPIARLALAQDTGAAIRGVGRVDIFVGSGEQAELAAAMTSRPGELYLLVHRDRGPKRLARRKP